MHWLFWVFQKRLGLSQLVTIGLKDSAAALPYSRAVHSPHPLNFVIVNNDLVRVAASLTRSKHTLARRAIFHREHFLITDGATVPRAALN